MPDVVLNVSGKNYGGWKSIRINQGIEQISGTFNLGLSEKWPGQIPDRPIIEGDECRVLIDKEVIISGYVDDVNPSHDSQGHNLSISGRDKTGDLVDCSAFFQGREWKNRTLLQIAQDLCGEYGVSVTADMDVGSPFSTYGIQPGETVFETIERGARIRGVLLVSDGKGGLIITRRSSERISTILETGKNILASNGQFSMRDRYSNYIVESENRGTDFTTPAQNTQATGEALDPYVRRKRTLIILSEEQGHVKALKDRAHWEASTRAGRSGRVTVTTQGWKHKDGLWQPNRIIRVKDDLIKINQDLLIVAVTFLLDDAGTKTELSLCSPDAFKLRPITEKKKSNQWT